MVSLRFWQGSVLATGLLLALNADPALAQRVSENAVAQASDAFGMAVGNEKTGLYSSEDIRGFNPVDAGNARIEGLYFDQMDRVSQRLLNGSTIHVGISAQHYPFPAPTGIVDYALTVPGDRFRGTLDLEYGEYGGPRFALDLKVPLAGERLGLVAGIGARHQVEGHGSSTNLRNFGTLLAWRPYAGAQVLAFASGIYGRSDEARPTLFPAGNAMPPRVPRRIYLGQSWTAKNYDLHTNGAIARLPIGDYRLEAAVFQSRRKTMTAFADLLSGVQADGSASARTIIADGHNHDNSVSGEVRLMREWSHQDVRHGVTFSLRGRAKDRLFGGTQKIALGPSSASTADVRAQPAIALGLKNSDRVHQLTYGLSYDLTWAGRGSFNVSMAQSQYRKTVDFADPARGDVTTRDRPVLWNVTGSVIATRHLAFYAGYVKGQEEALIAPEIAINRSEAPPAIRTRQVEVGLRYALAPGLSFVAGLFSIKKPYYNLDPALRYRQLGMLDNRGLELSLAGKLAPGLAVVAGTVLLDSRVSGEAVDSGLIGLRPVGSSRRRSAANLDWRSHGGTGALSFDLAYEGRGPRAANTANSFSVPARNAFDLGMRYRFDLWSAKALVRAQVLNLFNSYGWAVTSSGGFLYSDPRTATVQLLVDF